MPAIEASRLTKVYRTYRKERGLWGSVKGLLKRRYDETREADEVSFQIKEGEFVGFLGPNGAGENYLTQNSFGVAESNVGGRARSFFCQAEDGIRDEAPVQFAHG